MINSTRRILQVTVNLPLSVITALRHSGEPISAQVSGIVETFDWGTLPPGGSDVQAFRRLNKRMVCFRLSPSADQRWRDYCEKQSKYLNYSITQAFAALGITESI